MILFDYGQTLVNEKKFDGIAGTNAVLQYAVKTNTTTQRRRYRPQLTLLTRNWGDLTPKEGI